MTKQDMASKLKAMADHAPSLRSEVAAEALDYGSDDNSIKNFFVDLAVNGCISGMVTRLIYYSDTHKFYDRHYDEIEQLREDFQQQTGMTLEPKGDLKNWYAWFAFEQMAFAIASELGI